MYPEEGEGTNNFRQEKNAENADDTFRLENLHLWKCIAKITGVFEI